MGLWLWERGLEGKREKGSCVLRETLSQPLCGC